VPVFSEELAGGNIFLAYFFFPFARKIFLPAYFFFPRQGESFFWAVFSFSRQGERFPDVDFSFFHMPEGKISPSQREKWAPVTIFWPNHLALLPIAAHIGLSESAAHPFGRAHFWRKRSATGDGAWLHWEAMTERLLTVEEFAQRTRQHKETIRRQIRRGAIATVQTGRKHLIPESLATVRAGEKRKRGEEEKTGQNPPLLLLSSAPPLADPPLDLEALFAPPTPEEIARRLEAFKVYDSDAAPDEDEGEGVDLERDPWGYEERADRLMEGHR